MKFFFEIVLILISLSILTLYERKIIALSQSRLSPQENMINGLIQPLIDALKLLNKEMKKIEKKIQNNIFMLMFCMLMFLLSIFFWLTLPIFLGEETNLRFNLIMFLTILSISIYPIIFMSFFSHSKYPFMALLRMVSQSISYEINFSILIILMVFLNKNYSNHLVLFFSKYSFIALMFLSIMLIFISIIESFRSPFDYTESESELVSGFTSEMGSIKFTFVFMSEYSLMVFYIMFTSYLYMYYYFMLWLLIFLYMYMFSRSVLPRLRYDYLMILCWFNMFPSIVFLFFISF